MYKSDLNSDQYNDTLNFLKTTGDNYVSNI